MSDACNEQRKGSRFQLLGLRLGPSFNSDVVSFAHEWFEAIKQVFADEKWICVEW